MSRKVFLPLAVLKGPRGCYRTPTCCVQLIKCMKATVKCCLGDVLKRSETWVVLSKGQV